MAINAHVQLHQEGAVRAVIVNGIAVISWVDTDKTSEAFARVLLVRQNIAKATHVAKAFGCGRATVYRDLKSFEQEGLTGLESAKRGPKAPRLFGDAVMRRVVALKRKGVGATDIGVRLGVSESGVREALKRAGYAPRGVVQLALEARGEPDTAGTDSQPQAASSGPENRQGEDAATSIEPLQLVAGVPGTAEPERPAIETAVPPATSTSTQEEARKDAGSGPERVEAASGQEGVLPGDPWDRSLDRFCARMGMLTEAAPQFADCQGVVGLGVLLAVPALVATGLFESAVKVYRGFGAAFYGVRSVFVCLSLMALLRVKRAEHLRGHSPPTLGRMLGLDRVPEVKTLRRKVGELARRGKSAQLQELLAGLRVAAHPELMGFLYCDGHVRAYSGKVELPKAHVTRMRLSMPATVDHWINDRDGEPLLVVTATPTGSLAKEMLGIAREVKRLLGERRATIVFDRGGWSPKLFAELIEMGFDVLTYRKGRIPKVRKARFQTRIGTFDGREVSYALAERRLTLAYKGGKLTLREVVRLSENGEHQTSIVTNREDLSDVEVAYRMFERWRQENFFKYMGEEFALDALVSYGTEPADPERDVPNPKHRLKSRVLAEARGEVARLERLLGEAAAKNPEGKRPTMRGFKIANAGVGKQLRKAQAKVVRLRAELSRIPPRVTAAKAAGGKAVKRLDTETKRLTDVVKMVAYQAETALFRLLRPHYSRHEDEGRKLLASAMRLKGDIEVGPGELRITLEAAASPNRTLAIAKLCNELNATDTVYPGTRLRLRYSIREA